MSLFLAGAIAGGVIVAILVVVIIILLLIYLKRRREAARAPQIKIEKSNMNGHDNKGLTADEEWEMEQHKRQLSPAIVEQDVRPRNSTTLARPRKDMPPENVNRPKKRYSSALRQSLGDANSPPRHSNVSQNGTPPSKVGSPTSNGSANGSISDHSVYTPLGRKEGEENPYTGLKKAAQEKQTNAKDNEYDEVDLR